MGDILQDATLPRNERAETPTESSITKLPNKILINSPKISQPAPTVACSSESESDHSKSFNDSENKNKPAKNANVHKSFSAKDKSISKIPPAEVLSETNNKNTSPDTQNSDINLSLDKTLELVDDVVPEPETDEDVGDSIIGLESDYTETEIDSDSLASIANLNALKIKTLKMVEEKV